MLEGWELLDYARAYFGAGCLIGCTWAWNEKTGKSAGVAIVLIPIFWPLALWVTFGVFLQYVGDRWRRGGRVRD
jgi:hypothetical protein